MSPLGGSPLGGLPLGGAPGGAAASITTRLVTYLAGTDISTLVLVNTLNVEDTLDGRNTCSFSIAPGSSGVVPVVGNSVRMEWDGQVIFAGTVDEYELIMRQPNAGAVYRLQCVDWTQIAERRIVAEEYADTHAEAIIADLITEYLAGDGIVGSYVEDGPLISKAVFPYVTAADAFTDLANEIGYAWYIDYDKQLHFFARSTNLAPVTGSSSVFFAESVRKIATRDKYRNAQYIRAGNDITDSLTEQFTGDGKVRTFKCALPLATAPTITVNGAPKTVGILQVDTGYDWYWNKDSDSISQDNAGTVLTTADTLSVTATFLYPLRMYGLEDSAISERQSVEGGTGIYEEIEDVQLDGRQLVADKLTAILRKYARVQARFDGETEQDGLRSGQLLTLSIPTYGLTGTWLITNISIRDEDGKRLRYRVTAVDGENLGGWQEFFSKIEAAGRDFSIRENESLGLVKNFREPIAVTDGLVASAATSVCGVWGPDTWGQFKWC